MSILWTSHIQLRGASIRTSVSRRSQLHTPLVPTVVFDTYWRFAAERLAIYYRRLGGSTLPWTTDPVLAAYRFTNTYRVVDRVSQYLIREVQYSPERSQDPSEVFFRTLLFKVFNKIETWETLEHEHGPLAWRTVNLDALDRTLSRLLARRTPIYSAAYIIPTPPFGASRKHTNHLRLLARMMEERLPDRLRQAPDLRSVYRAILSYPGFGRFLSFQYTIDLNYSTLLNFSECDFVMTGPGALDGISKCFASTGGLSPEAIIRFMTDRQEHEFSSRGIDFPGLFSRPLQLIDCQNLFCEISKYSRVAHPEITGIANRKKIKQTFKLKEREIPQPFFPPRWELSTSDMPGFSNQRYEITPPNLV